MRGDTPADILKGSIEVHLNLIAGIIRKSFCDGVFPEVLKFAEVSPSFKRNDSLNKENSRPLSVLSLVSKVLERLIFTQLEGFMQEELSSLLTDFKRNHSTQHCLVNTFKGWQKKLDNGWRMYSIYSYI